MKATDWWTAWILVGMACITLSDVKAKECRVACLLSGWDSGDYLEKEDLCRCMDYRSYETLTQSKRLLLGGRKKGAGGPVVVE